MGESDRVLVIDDDQGVLRFFERVLSRMGYAVTSVMSGREGVALYAEAPFDAVVVDLKLPDIDGVEIIRRLRQDDENLAAVVVTGHGTVQTAVAAMKAGALDYMSKPVDMDELIVVLGRAVESRRKFMRLHHLERQVLQHASFEGLVGVSQAMMNVYSLIRRVAKSDTTVLLQGETGTGKELVARAIHTLSARDGFLPINCGALPDDILESELFGHEKGAFTGAIRRKYGLIEQADGGSLFLDEIEEMSPALQVKLLRAIQEREVLRVGGDRPVPVRFRLIASTNVDLRAQMDRGAFRPDLFYRLSVMVIDLPPLCHRGGDVPLLTRHFIRRFAEDHDMASPDITSEAMMVLTSYSWPGNVRELENALAQAVLLSEGATIGVKHLPAHIVDGVLNGAEAAPYRLPLKLAREQFEKQYLEDALKRAEGVVAEAARLSGINRQHFYAKMKRYGLDRPE